MRILGLTTLAIIAGIAHAENLRTEKDAASALSVSFSFTRLARVKTRGLTTHVSFRSGKGEGVASWS